MITDFASTMLFFEVFIINPSLDLLVDTTCCPSKYKGENGFACVLVHQLTLVQKFQDIQDVIYGFFRIHGGALAANMS